MVPFESTVWNKYLMQIDVKKAVQTVVVAFSFLLFSQYWRVDEHVVFILVLFLTALAMFNADLSKPITVGSTATVYLFIAFLTWIMFSVLWAPTLHSSMAYALLTVITGATAVMQGFLFALPVVIRGVSLGVFVIALHVVSVGFPGGPSSIRGLGFGLYTNPSSLSFVLGIVLIALVFSLNRSYVTWILVAGFGTIAVMWLWGLSLLTPFLALLGALFVGVAIAHVRMIPRKRRNLAAYGYITVFLLGGFLFWFFRGTILRPLGKDASLGDRIPLWQAYFEAALWRPWLGSGWGSTVGWDFPLSRNRLYPVYEWFPAHSGYLDIALMLGFIGLFLFLAGLFALYWESLGLAVTKSLGLQTAFTPVLLTYLILNDVVATSFPRLIGIFLVGVMIGNTARARGGSYLSGGSNNSWQERLEPHSESEH